MNTLPPTKDQAKNGDPSQLPATPQGKKTLYELFNSPAMLAEIGKVTRGYMTGDYLVSILFQSIAKNPDLLQCSPQSLMSSLKTLASMQCEPDGINGHLVPFKRYEQGQLVEVVCTPIPTARGLMRMSRNNGVRNLNIGIVRAGDEFRWLIEDGDFRMRHEEESWDASRRVIGVYCTWSDKAGCVHGCRMSFEEIDGIRKRSKTYNKSKDVSFGPWGTDWDQMALKTVIKRASKQWDLPLEIGVAMQQADAEEFGGTLEKREARVVGSGAINPFADVPAPELPNSENKPSAEPASLDCDELPGLDIKEPVGMTTNREDY